MISILLPFHREQNLLKRAIQSVIQQRDPEWELILIANGADQKTLDVASTVALSERRINIVTESQPGIAHALNRGLTQCRGRYIARLDADDEMPSERLALQRKFLDENMDFDLVSGRVKFVGQNENGYDLYTEQINSWDTEDAILKYRFVESPIAHPSVMFRRELIDRYGNYSTAAVPEDYELWMRWLTAGVRFHKIPQTVLHWYDSPKRLSRTHVNYERRAFDRVRMEYLLQLLPSFTKDRQLWICGGKYARKKISWLKSKGIHVTGIVDLVPRKFIDLKSLTYEQLPAPGELFLVSMVSNRGGYRIVEKVLKEKGYQYPQDFLLAA